MERLVKKVDLPIFGEMYIANADEVSLEATQALQEIFKMRKVDFYVCIL